MYRIIYPQSDTTIYEEHQFRNTSVDQILELTSKKSGTYIEDILDSGETYNGTYNSRILIKFDLSDIQSDIASGKISGPVTYYLNLKATEAEEIPLDYTIYAHAISGSWSNGTGFYNNRPEIKNGVSWKYRTDYLSAIPWISSSLTNGVTGSFISNSGGGVWYTGSQYTATQSFSYEDPSINMDITNIMNSWLSGSIPNEGMIIKHSTQLEGDNTLLGSIKFFSTDSHTVYMPKLEIHWTDYTLSGTGSFSEVNDDDYIVSMKNLKDTYIESEIARVNINPRERWPQRLYATSSYFFQNKRLPTGSYFSIYDYVTDEQIVRFSEGTRVNCDSNGNYIKLDCGSLLPERYYKLIFKIENPDDTVKMVDDGFYFKVRRI